MDFKKIFESILHKAPDLAAQAMPDCPLCDSKAVPLRCLGCGQFVCINHGFFSTEMQMICDDCVEVASEIAGWKMQKSTKKKGKKEGPWVVLGIERTASEDEINKAFREKSKDCHPDKGGNPEDFKRLNKAREEMLKIVRGTHGNP